MSTSKGAGGPIRLRRDGQQWEFDRAVKDTGRVFHFQHNARGRLPESVKMHAMISKHTGRTAERLEQLAAAEAAAGHPETALEFYYDAAYNYAHAQHPVFALNEEKRYLHGGVLRCYDEVRRLAPHTIEKIDVPWRDTLVSGYLHHADVEGPAPLIFYIPGCDMTKEMVPHPLYNFARRRGMHLFVFDGPGQGESNMRGIKVTLDNYEDAASTALTVLLDRPEIDAQRVGLYSMSFGSYWGARFAATDDRLAAASLIWASICDKYHLFEAESPRYKQLFSFLTGLETEDELDAFIAQMGLEGLLPQISCPTLLTVGQYDPRSPLEEVYDLYDLMDAPRELWVYEDQHHGASLTGGGSQWHSDHHWLTVDWLRDRLSGTPIDEPGVTRWVAAKGFSPNDPRTRRSRHWFSE